MVSRSEDPAALLAVDYGFSPASNRSSIEASEDSILVRAARDGDRRAFGCLYDRHARMVHGVLLARVPLCDVDDLVQDVFLLALRKLSTLRQASSFAPWLAAIARNVANDYHRRSMPQDPLTPDAPDTGERIDDAAARQAPAAFVLAVVKTLPEVYRETLILRLVEGMTGPEIAARTGLTHGSVRVNLHRGMRQLRAKLSLNPAGNPREPERP
jgi:RNA polymerase sigma-70 factor, ECF subfamily